MFSIFYPVLTLSLPRFYYPYSVLYVSSKLYSYQVKQFEEYTKLLNNNKKEICKRKSEYSFKVDYCIDNLKTLESAQFSTGNDINNKISKLSKYSEFVFILCDGVIPTIDLNNLKTDNIVYISNETDLYEDNIIKKYSKESLFSYLTVNTAKAIQKITKASLNEKAKPFFDMADKLLGKIELEDDSLPDTYPDTPILNLSIVGDIKKKVSYLSISGIRLKIVNSDLNVNYLYSYRSEIDQESKDIRTYFYTVDRESHYRLYGSVFYKINVEQYGIIMFDTYRSIHEIVFFDDFWAVISINYDKYFLQVYHFMAKSFNWIVCGRLLYLAHNNTESFGEKNLLNITLINSYPRTTLSQRRTNDIQTVEIQPFGDWSVIKNKPKIAINYDPNAYYLRRNETVEKMFSISDPEVPYSYVVKYKRKNYEKKLGYILGIIYVIIFSLILIVIAIVHRPKNESTSEEEISDNNDYL